MKEPWGQFIRRWLHNPIPVRRSSSIATWWEWGGRGYRLQKRPNPAPHFHGYFGKGCMKAGPH